MRESYRSAAGACTIESSSGERGTNQRENAVKRLRIALTIGLICSTTILNAEDAPRPDKWISLFNGRDLEGWTPKIRGYAAGENCGNTFRVEDGLLKVAYDQYDAFEDRFGHLFYKDEFSNYRLPSSTASRESRLPAAPGGRSATAA